MTAPNDDAILQVLDSLEMAIVEEQAFATPEENPPLPAPSGRATAALPTPKLRTYPDAPPRRAGGGGPVRGTTATVLAAFKWGA